MTFNPRSLEAKIAINKILPEELPSVACDALEAGLDGPTIRRIAGLTKPSGWETDSLMPAFLLETGMRLPSRDIAVLRVAYEMARDVIDGHKDPVKCLREFARLCNENDYPAPLMTLYMLDDELDWDERPMRTEEEQFRNEVRDELIRLIREYEVRLTLHD